MDSFTGKTRSFDGEVPRRTHRRRDPWVNLKLSPRELAVGRRMAPVWELVSVLATDQFFLEAVEAVHAGESPDAFASRYVWRDGPTRRVVRELLVRAASTHSDFASHAVLALAGFTVMAGDELEPGSLREWPHAKRRDAAVMLARVGAGRCIRCGDGLAESDARRRRYCAAHQPRDSGTRVGRAEKVERADRDAIAGLLNAVGDALGVA